LFVSLYLLLYRLGFYGSLLCGAGSCGVVQASKYASFLGFPVSGWGVGWYSAVFVLPLLALHPRWWRRSGSWPDRLLALATAGGLAFTAYLTSVEVFLLRAVCMWCVVSAVLTVLIFLLAMPWRVRHARA
jgi:uncharacterized membrane protein